MYLCDFFYKVKLLYFSRKKKMIDENFQILAAILFLLINLTNAVIEENMYLYLNKEFQDHLKINKLMNIVSSKFRYFLLSFNRSLCLFWAQFIIE